MKIDSYFKILLILVSTTVSMQFAYAQESSDVVVTCHLTDCDARGDSATLCAMVPVTGAPLFGEYNMLPSQSVTRILTVQNTGACDCGSVKLKTKNVTYGRLTLKEIFSPTIPTDMPSRLFTVIKQDANDIYGTRNGTYTASSTKNMNDVFTSTTPIPLGNVLVGSTKTFAWVVTFDPLAGNEYQGISTQFDFDMEFVCGEPSVPPTNTFHPDERTFGGGETPSGLPSIFPLQIGGTVQGTQSPTAPGQVQGITAPFAETDGVGTQIMCTDLYLWWLLFLAQAFLGVLYSYLYRSRYITKRVFHPTQVSTHFIASCIFYLNFCPWWDVYLSILIGAVTWIFGKYLFKEKV